MTHRLGVSVLSAGVPIDGFFPICLGEGDMYRVHRIASHLFCFGVALTKRWHLRTSSGGDLDGSNGIKSHAAVFLRMKWVVRSP